MNTLPDSVYGDDYKHVNIQIVIWRKLENPPKFIKPDISHLFGKKYVFAKCIRPQVLFTKFSIRFSIPLVYGTCRLRNYNVDKYKTNLPNLTAASFYVIDILVILIFYYQRDSS